MGSSAGTQKKKGGKRGGGGNVIYFHCFELVGDKGEKWCRRNTDVWFAEAVLELCYGSQRGRHEKRGKRDNRSFQSTSWESERTTNGGGVKRGRDNSALKKRLRVRAPRRKKEKGKRKRARPTLTQSMKKNRVRVPNGEKGRVFQKNEIGHHCRLKG